MGRLAGFRYREIVKRSKRYGFDFDRRAAGSHEIRFNPKTDHDTTIPNHPGDMPEGTLRAILKQAGIAPEDFSEERRTRLPKSGAPHRFLSSPYLSMANFYSRTTKTH